MKSGPIAEIDPRSEEVPGNRVPSPSFRLIVLIHSAFLLTGVVTTMLGPLLPELSARWSLSDTGAGSLFAVQSAGSLLGIGLSTWLTPRVGYLRMLALGSALLALGSGGLSWGSAQTGVASILVYGIGLGIAIPGANVLTAELNPGRRPAALNILNSAWCLGAFLGPSLIAVAFERASLGFFLWALAAALAVSVAGYWRASRGEAGGIGLEGPSVRSGTGAGLRDWSLPWYFGALLFLYVGVETATWGWIATYARRMESAEAIWPLLQSAFWLAILIGRLSTPLLLRWVAAPKMVLASLVLVLAGTVQLTLVAQASQLLLGAALAGAGMACIYPTTVAAFSASGCAANSRASGLVFSMAILGGAAVPWLVGLLSDALGSLRVAMVAPAMGSLAMIALQVRLARRTAAAPDAIVGRSPAGKPK